MRQIPHFFKLTSIIVSILSLGFLQSCSGSNAATKQPLETPTCTQANCQNMLFIIIDGSLPENYTIEASDQKGDTVSVHCVNDEQYLPPTQDLYTANPSLCEDDGLHLVGFTPDVIDLKLYWDDHVKSLIVRPEYITFHSTATTCNPSCKISVVKMHVP